MPSDLAPVIVGSASVIGGAALGGVLSYVAARQATRSAERQAWGSLAAEAYADLRNFIEALADDPPATADPKEVFMAAQNLQRNLHRVAVLVSDEQVASQSDDLALRVALIALDWSNCVEVRQQLRNTADPEWRSQLEASAASSRDFIREEKQRLSSAKGQLDRYRRAIRDAR